MPGGLGSCRPIYKRALRPILTTLSEGGGFGVVSVASLPLRVPRPILQADLAGRICQTRAEGSNEYVHVLIVDMCAIL